MAKITITEALAEIPTIQKRVAKKQDFIVSYLYRQSAVRDPHEKAGGSAILIEQEMQSIGDLQNRLVAIRAAIQKANQENTITIKETTKTIGDWLTWRREISEDERRFLGLLSRKLQELRQDAIRKGVSVTDKDAGFTADFIVSIDEKRLAEDSENLEEILGYLDGQLSLKNATVLIEVP